VLGMMQNHSDLVKFSSNWDENYLLIKSLLQRFGTVAVEVIEKRFSMTQGRVQPFQPFKQGGQK